MIEKVLNYFIENKIKKLEKEQYDSLFFTFSKNIKQDEFRYFFKLKNNFIILKRNLCLARFKISANYRSQFIDIETDKVLFSSNKIEYLEGDIIVCDFNLSRPYYTYKKNNSYMLILLKERKYNKNPEIILDYSYQTFKPISNILELEKNYYYLAKIKDCSSYHIKSDYNYIKFEISKKICSITDPLYYSYKILIKNSIDFFISDEVYERIKDLNINSDLSENRLNYKDHLTFTIDGIDSKDFDDAISLKKEKDYFYLGVHIADVSNYVLQNNSLEELANKRQTSVYLHQLTIPMLPEKISNDICSLVENKERLTISVMYKYTYDFKLIDFSINKAKIISDKRLNYDLVNDFYKDENTILSADEILDNKLKNALTFLDKFNQVLEKQKEKRGYLKFESDELKFKFKNQYPTDVYLRQQGKSELLIENLMILANETVSKFMHDLELPTPYRVHEEPSLSDLEKVLNFLKSFDINYKIKDSKNLNKIYKDLLDITSKSKHSTILQSFLLRSMPKALYKEICLGHFGLGLKYYSHFTSPIRRYPDLLLHKILTELVLDVKDYDNRLRYYNSIIESTLKDSSQKERIALTSELESEKLMSILYLTKNTKPYYKAQIISCLENGFYCQLSNHITGYVALSNINEYFTFYEQDNCYIGSKGTRYKLGDFINVRVISLNEEKLLIDLGVYKK